MRSKSVNLTFQIYVYMFISYCIMKSFEEKDCAYGPWYFEIEIEVEAVGAGEIGDKQTNTR